MTIIVIYLCVGAFAGLVAGLFGLGGGVVIVPALIFTYSLLGMSPEYAIHLAVGTSLMTIVVTSISSIRAHHLKQAVDWPLAFSLIPGILVGSWLGGETAAGISGVYLQIAFGVFAMLVSVSMLRASPTARRRLPGAPGRMLVGGVIGWIAALFGIGGGSLSVPFFSYCGVVMQRAVATSAALGFPLAVAGALSYMWQGMDTQELLPEWTTGYVYWPAFVGMAVCSTPFARVGAMLAHRLPSASLKRFFAIFLSLVGIYLVLSGIIHSGR